MSYRMLPLVLLVLTVAALIGGGARLVLAGSRARRRADWELDRAAWRRWMRRP